jgi:hypothetical protein
MKSKSFLRLIPSVVLLALAGCANDSNIRNLVTASHEALRDCDAIGAKVLEASYKEAGENQGRLIIFLSFTPNKIKGTGNEFGEELFPVIYSLDQNNVFKSFPMNESSVPEKADYLTRYSNGSVFVQPSLTHQWGMAYGGSINEGILVRSGVDARQLSKTNNSLSCRLFFRGEGNVSGGGYIVTSDGSGISWRKAD